MANQDIRNLLFDLGNVLIDIDIEGAHARLKQLLREDASFDVVEKALLNYECGKISTDIFINKLLSQSQRQVQALDIIEGWNSMLLGIPLHRLDMLGQLKSNYHLFVLSNTNALHLEWVHRYVRREYGIDRFEDYFTTVYYSHLVGDRKPNPSIFRHVVEDAKMLPGQTLYMDDVQENLDAAGPLGFSTYLVKPGEEIGEFLRAEGYL